MSYAEPGLMLDGSDSGPPPSSYSSPYQWVLQNVLFIQTPTHPLSSPPNNSPSYGSILPGPAVPKPPPALVHISFRKTSFYLLCSGAIVGILIGYMLETPLDSSIRQHLRSKWVIDKRIHQAWLENMQAEKEKWLEDRRECQERDRLEEEDRVRKKNASRRALEWHEFRRGRCVRYEMWDYQATLANVPMGFNAMAECMNKTMHINGQDLVPARCEDQGYCGKAVAHWEVAFNEPGCTLFFSYISDKGCSGGQR